MQILKILKSISLIICPVALFSLIIIGEVAATTYYVSPSGSDTNNGSTKAPFRNIQKAADIVNPGDTVIVKAGTYYERVTMKTSGNSNNRITFEGERGPNGEWLTIIDGSDTISITWTDETATFGYAVYSTTDITYEPLYMGLDDDSFVFRVHPTYMSDGRGFDYLSKAPGATEMNQYNDIVVQYWDGVEALYGKVSGKTYIRFRDEDDPNNKDLRPSDTQRLVDLTNKQYITIRNFKMLNAVMLIELAGASCQYNIIEDNHLMNAARRMVYIHTSSSYNKIRNNEINLGLLSSYQPGAWTADDWLKPTLPYKYGVREHYWKIFKREVGADNFWPTGFYQSNAGDGNEFYGNEVYDLIAAVQLRGGPKAKIYDNTIHHISGSAIFLIKADQVEIFDNLIYDSHQSFRPTNLENSDYVSLYIYRNRIWSPRYIETLFYPTWLDPTPPPGYTAPNIHVYHNTFVGGRVAIGPSGYDATYGGLSDSLIVNNVFNSSGVMRGSQAFNDDVSMMGEFDYNYLNFKWGWRGEPAWNGSNNVEKLSAAFKIWDDNSLPDFKLPKNSSARNAGIDLSKSFTISGTTYNPLPGMSPGYFSGSAPDLGAIQFGSSGGSDTQSPSIPTNLAANVVSENQIDLSWSTSTDNTGVTGYKIYRDGTQITTTSSTSYSDTGLSSGTSYTYTVSAYDAAGNSSSQSIPASATTQSSPPPGQPSYTILKITTSPTIDGNLSEYANANSITFSPATGGNTVIVKALWDTQALYLGYEVTDTELNASVTIRDGSVWGEDGIEWFIDTNNNGGGSANPNSAYMLPDDYHGIVNTLNTQYDSQGTTSGSPTSSYNGNWTSAVLLNGTNNNNADTDTSYTVEVKIPWTSIGYSTPPSDDTIISMSFAVNDKDSSSSSYVMWPNITTAFENASNWQDVKLSGTTIGISDDDTSPSPPFGLQIQQ